MPMRRTPLHRTKSGDDNAADQQDDRRCCTEASQRRAKLNSLFCLFVNIGRSRTYISFSIVIGRSRTRLPVAWNTAFAMAAAAPTTPISPTVLPPRALA